MAGVRFEIKLLLGEDNSLPEVTLASQHQQGGTWKDDNINFRMERDRKVDVDVELDDTHRVVITGIATMKVKYDSEQNALVIVPIDEAPQVEPLGTEMKDGN